MDKDNELGRLGLRGGGPWFGSKAAKLFGWRKKTPPLVESTNSGIGDNREAKRDSSVFRMESRNPDVDDTVPRIEKLSLPPTNPSPRPSSHLPSLTPSYSPWEWINGIPPGLTPEEKRRHVEMMAAHQALYRNPSPPKEQVRREEPKREGSAAVLLRRRKGGVVSPAGEGEDGGVGNVEEIVRGGFKEMGSRTMGDSRIVSSEGERREPGQDTSAAALSSVPIFESSNSYQPRRSTTTEQNHLSTNPTSTEENPRYGGPAAAAARPRLFLPDRFSPDRHRNLTSDCGMSTRDEGYRQDSMVSAVPSEAMFNPSTIEKFSYRSNAERAHRPIHHHSEQAQNKSSSKDRPRGYIHGLRNPNPTPQNHGNDPRLGTLTSTVSSLAMFDRKTYEPRNGGQVALKSRIQKRSRGGGLTAKKQEESQEFIYGMIRPPPGNETESSNRHLSLASEVFFEKMLERTKKPAGEQASGPQVQRMKVQEYPQLGESDFAEPKQSPPRRQIDSFYKVSKDYGASSVPQDDSSSSNSAISELVTSNIDTLAQNKNVEPQNSPPRSRYIYKHPYEISTTPILGPTKVKSKPNLKLASLDPRQEEDSMSVALKKLEEAVRSHENPPAQEPPARPESWLASPYFQPSPVWDKAIDVEAILGFHVPEYINEDHSVGEPTAVKPVVREPAFVEYRTTAPRKGKNNSSGELALETQGKISSRRRLSTTSDRHFRRSVHQPMEQINEDISDDEKSILIGMEVGASKLSPPYPQSPTRVHAPRKSAVRAPSFSPHHSLSTTRLLSLIRPRLQNPRQRTTSDRQSQPQREDILATPEKISFWDSAIFCFQENDLHSSLDYLRQIGRDFPPGSARVPNSALLFANIGLIYAHLGDYKVASKFFAKACSNEPQTSLFWFLLGCSMWELESWGRAKLYFDAGWYTFPWGVEVVDYTGRGLDFLLEKRDVWRNGHVSWNQMRKMTDGMAIPQNYKNLGIDRMPGGRMFMSAAGLSLDELQR